jgi:hypothetical protein
MKSNRKNKFAATVDWETHRRLRSESMKWQFLALSIGHLQIRLVIRHAFEKYADLEEKSLWKKLELGIWFKRNMCIGTGIAKTPLSNFKLRPEYSVGVNLILLKFWISFSWKALQF